jgi:hypothetical protein
MFLRKQVRTLQESNTEKDKTIETLRTDFNELRIRDAICQSNYSSLEKEHTRCSIAQDATFQDYEIYRTLVESTYITQSVLALLFKY